MSEEDLQVFKQLKEALESIDRLTKSLDNSEKARIDQMGHYITRCCELTAELEELKTGMESPLKCKCEACEEARNRR